MFHPWSMEIASFYTFFRGTFHDEVSIVMMRGEFLILGTTVSVSAPPGSSSEKGGERCISAWRHLEVAAL